MLVRARGSARPRRPSSLADLGAYRVDGAAGADPTAPSTGRPRPSSSSASRPPEQHATIVNAGLAVAGGRARSVSSSSASAAPGSSGATSRRSPRRRDGDPGLAAPARLRARSALAERVPAADTDTAHRGRPGRRRLQRDARPRRAAPSTRGTRASSGCASSSPTPRTSCARRSPRSGGMPSCPAASREPVPAGGHPRDRPGRVRGDPDDRAGRGPAAARPPRRRPAARPTRPVDLSSWSSTRSATPTPPRPTTAGSSTCPTSRSRSRATRRGCTRSSPTCSPTPAPTRRPAPSCGRRSAATASGSRLSVHDNGPGVPEALQPNVFERFARGDDAHATGPPAAPVSGLSIVAAVAKAHGGRVALDSQPGDTTFTVLLPA